MNTTSGVGALYLESARFRFQAMKELADKAIAQLDDRQLIASEGETLNSIAIILQHLAGNMLSRWTGFLTSDGEKPARDRDGEFTQPAAANRATLLDSWESGWRCLFTAIDALAPEDLTRTVHIRGQELGVIDAINRQIAHYAMHIGQIVHIAKEQKGDAWQSLSIPLGTSTAYAPAKRD